MGPFPALPITATASMVHDSPLAPTLPAPHLPGRPMTVTIATPRVDDPPCAASSPAQGGALKLQDQPPAPPLPGGGALKLQTTHDFAPKLPEQPISPAGMPPAF